MRDIKELWKRVVGFETSYEVSNHGRVRSLITNKVLAGSRGSNGYPHVILTGRVDRAIHRMVLDAFVGPRPDGHEAAHLDGSRDNNCLWNLAWVTRTENMAHKKLHGRQVQGSNQHKAKLTEADIPKIRELAKCGISAARISREYFPQVTPSTIEAVVRRKTWKHL